MSACARGALCGALLVAMQVMQPAVVHAGAWPIATLEPPGMPPTRHELIGVALAGETVVSTYVDYAAMRYVVMLRPRIPGGGWGPSQILVTGDPVDGPAPAIAADVSRMAVGLPHAPGGGRVDTYRRSGDTWAFEASLAAPAGAAEFGRRVAVRGDLLVATLSSASSPAGAGVESYRFATTAWQPAGYRIESIAGTSEFFVDTDGERIAVTWRDGFQTVARDVDGTWIVEASGTPLLAAPTSFDGDRLFVGGTDGAGSGALLMSYWRTGSAWTQAAYLADVTRYANDGGFLIAQSIGARAAEPLRTRILSRGPAGGFVPTLEAALPPAPLALRGSIALAGDQSFSFGGTTGWRASGLAGGLQPWDGSVFGASLVVVGGRVWVGAPGHAGTDSGSGAVWLAGLPGSTWPTAMTSLLPAAPALNRRLGASLAADPQHVAALSSQAGDTLSTARVEVYGASAQQPAGIEVMVPDLEGRLYGIAHGIGDGTLVVTRDGAGGSGIRSDILVYEDLAEAAAPTQVITTYSPGMPAFRVTQNAVARGDWLLAGMSMYRRSSPGAYVPAGTLPYALNFSPSARRGASSGDWLVIPGSDDFGTAIGTVFELHPTSGWQNRGVVDRNGFNLAGGCVAMAMDGTDIACLTLDASRVRVFLARRDGPAGGWRVIAGGEVPQGAAAETAPSVALSQGLAIVGLPHSGEIGGVVDGGRAFVMTFDETILRTGFEAPAP